MIIHVLLTAASASEGSGRQGDVSAPCGPPSTASKSSDSWSSVRRLKRACAADLIQLEPTLLLLLLLCCRLSGAAVSSEDEDDDDNNSTSSPGWVAESASLSEWRTAARRHSCLSKALRRERNMNMKRDGQRSFFFEENDDDDEFELLLQVDDNSPPPPANTVAGDDVVAAPFTLEKLDDDAAAAVRVGAVALCSKHHFAGVLLLFLLFLSWSRHEICPWSTHRRRRFSDVEWHRFCFFCLALPPPADVATFIYYYTARGCCHHVTGSSFVLPLLRHKPHTLIYVSLQVFKF